MRRFQVAKLLHRTLDELDSMTERELQLWHGYARWEYEQVSNRDG